MKSLPYLAAGALALALAACGAKSKPDPYLQNVPDASALTLDTSATAAGALATATGVTLDPQPVTTAGDDLALVHRKVEALNAAVRGVFEHLEALTASGGQALPGGVKQWGPADRCVEPDGAGGCVANGKATLRLRVVLFSDHMAAFRLVARPIGSTLESAYVPVLSGYLLRGAMDRRGAGKLWVNHENLRSVASGFTGTGWLAAGFAAGPVAKTVTYRMVDFTRDPALHEPITATFRGWKNGAGIVRARVAGLDASLYPGPGTELGVWRAVWAQALGARAFTLITDGDVTAGKFWFARACYPAGATLPSYKEWFECDKTKLGLPYPPAECVKDVLNAGGAGLPDPISTSSAATWADTVCAKAYDPSVPAVDRDELLPPTLPPRDVDDDRDEDGDHTGLAPEPCPTTVQVQNPDPTPPGMSMGGGMM